MEINNDGLEGFEWAWGSNDLVVSDLAWELEKVPTSLDDFILHVEKELIYVDDTRTYECDMFSQKLVDVKSKNWKDTNKRISVN